MAFNHIGGVPARIRYDNLKPAGEGAQGPELHRVGSGKPLHGAATTASTSFFVDRAVMAPTRRAVWKARSVGSAAVTWYWYLLTSPSLAELNRFIAAAISSMTPV
ncbi:MAG: hypothetical protein U0R18_08060 [Mycobacterium sp.]